VTRRAQVGPVRPIGAVVGAAVALCLLLSACTTNAPTRPAVDRSTPLLETSVDVDTPQLRDLKQQAGVEPCPVAPEPAAGGADAAGLPELTLACLGGGRDVTLSDLDGPLVINLWAQWCGPCREELPYYQQLHERAGDRLDVLGIDWQDTQPAGALQLLEALGVTYPQLADPAGRTREPFGIRRGLPGIVLVDEDGVVQHVEYVVITSYDQLRDLVVEHLGLRV